MQALHDYGLIIVLVIVHALQITLTWFISQRAEAAGYDKGYDDAKRGHETHIEALHNAYDDLHREMRQAAAAHRLDRDSLIQDCDKRIAHYARRASPFTDEDAAELLKISGPLRVTAVTAERVGAITHKYQALYSADSATRMAERIRAVLAQAEHRETVA